MPKRAMNWLPMILLPTIIGGVPGSVLVESAIAQTAAETNAQIAEQAQECLAAPEGSTGPGEHWYYRIERGSNRHCWYIKGAGQTAARTVPLTAKPAAQPAPAAANPSLQPSIADARAEFAPAPRAVPQTPNPFPDPVSVVPPADPSPAAGTAVADADVSNEDPSSPQIANTPALAAADRLPGPAANSAADVAPSNLLTAIRDHLRPRSPRRPADVSVWMLVSAFGGALALVALATGLAKFGRGTLSRRKRRHRGHKIWGERPVNPASSVRAAPSMRAAPITTAAPSMRAAPIIPAAPSMRAVPVMPAAPSMRAAVRAAPAAVPDAPPLHNNDDGVPMGWIRTARATQEAKQRNEEEAARQGEEVERLLARAPRRSVV